MTPTKKLSDPQSHKNLCSVAALLRRNFASLLNFGVIFTNIHAVWAKNVSKVMLLCGKIQKKKCVAFSQNI